MINEIPQSSENLGFDANVPASKDNKIDEPVFDIEWVNYNENNQYGHFCIRYNENSYILGRIENSSQVKGIKDFVGENQIIAHIKMVEVDEKKRGVGISKLLVKKLRDELIKNKVFKAWAVAINLESFNSVYNTVGEDQIQIFDGGISEGNKIDRDQALEIYRKNPDYSRMYLLLDLSKE